MSFKRNTTTTWRDDVPGTRWFKSDLHIHTIDDIPGGRVKIPPHIKGEQYSEIWMRNYARLFLQAIVHNGVKVAGLTPHAVRLGSDPARSGVWRIVEEWNGGKDDDGVPFREKIFAIFPGFEPSLHAGQRGLHLLFLFDPEIGKERYLRAFDLLMGGVSPWENEKLRISSKRPEGVFEDLARFHQREKSEEEEWGYLILAPHIDNENGLLGAQKSQILQLFAHGEIAGLELGDNKLPKDTLADRSWLSDGMKEHRQAFFHSSDAYDSDSIGNRFTWIKLGSPRIKALRQAFVASESRMRMGFERTESGDFKCINDSPDVTSHRRPWLKELTVKGTASFFGGSAGETRFRFSPDLTCVIGGSMTGKSTLLDGLRSLVDARPPDDSILHENVNARAEKFLAGQAEVRYSCPGRDSTASLGEQWPAQFFAQSELQRLTQEQGTIEEILSRLVPEVGKEIMRLNEELGTLNCSLRGRLKPLNDLDEALAESEQLLGRAKNAKDALSAFSQAGISRLHSVAQERQDWEKAKETASKLHSHLQAAIDEYLVAQHVPVISDTLLGSGSLNEAGLELHQQWQELEVAIKLVAKNNESWILRVQNIVKEVSEIEGELQTKITRELATQGYDATKLDEFAALNERATLFPDLEAKYERICKVRADAIEDFEKLRQRRRKLTDKLRKAFDLVTNSLQGDFKDRIRVRRIREGNNKDLDRFLRELRKKGITRWWNDLDDDCKPSSEKLLILLQEGTLRSVEMSDAVQQTFRESLTSSKKRELEAIYCRDTYELEMQMDDQTYRPLTTLSGGRRVSVLLALLLETGDNRPLVIDQPEDELDNRFLSDTVLPALKKLKGRRQVILATHNANIVVNGDADLVLHLKANANHGRVDRMGVIEESVIRDIIVSTVDGGEEAFRLRLLKYGF